MSAPGDVPTFEYDQHWNAVAAAGVAFDQEWIRLRKALIAAREYGLSIEGLCAASGIYEDVVRQLVGEEPW